MKRKRRALRRRTGHARTLGRRYGHASSHPLFPRLVMTLEKKSPGEYIITGKLQRHYGGRWESVISNVYDNVRAARGDLEHVGAVVASEHDVPPSHVEYP